MIINLRGFKNNQGNDKLMTPKNMAITMGLVVVTLVIVMQIEQARTFIGLPAPVTA